ncbi:MAG: hypothetical protein KDA24_29125 [Deltaproteobacteria bacterium]|nr:hypothetical protein [Deltaproteobacteria bacterium]
MRQGVRRCLVGLAVLLAACPSEDEPAPTGPGLVLPDISDIDFPSAMAEAIELTFTADMRASWAGHASTLEFTRQGCPDFWLSPQDASWQDHCTTVSGVEYNGDLMWSDALSLDGEDPESALGVTTQGARVLEGAAQVDDQGELLYSFVGSGSDALYRSEAAGYLQWRYSSRVFARVRGESAYPSDGATPGGMLLGLDLSYSGGQTSELSARGDVHLPGDRIATRFDSVSLDIELAGPGALLPDECQVEPRGWISLRDADAIWYDLVLQPRFTDDATDDPFPNEPYSRCEGCGTLYVRGVESAEVCVDFSSLFDGRLQPPDPSGYVLPVREQMGQ